MHKQVEVSVVVGEILDSVYSHGGKSQEAVIDLMARCKQDPNLLRLLCLKAIEVVRKPPHTSGKAA